MVKILLSPCLFIKNNEITNLGELINVLNFANEYLDVSWDMCDSSLLSENKWFSFPKYKTTIYNQFTSIVIPLLRKLNKNNVPVKASITNKSYNINCNSYIITDLEEFNSIINYVSLARDTLLMFVGMINNECDNDFNIIIDNNPHLIPIVKNPWIDESGNFNFFISEKIKNYDDPFPCKDVCKEIGSIKISKGNRALYEKYGDIIAKRNGYSKLSYSANQYKDAPYYKRNDNKYIICLDMLHGTFEVFKKQQGSRYENYQGEYDFCGNYIKAKKSDPNTHKCYKYY